MSEIGNVCNPAEDHCLGVTKIVHHHANEHFDWLISGHHSVNPSREVISILSCKYKRFTFVHPVSSSWIIFLKFKRQAIYTVLQKYADIGLNQNLFRSTTLDIIARLLDNAVFVCVHVAARFSKKIEGGESRVSASG